VQPTLNTFRYAASIVLVLAAGRASAAEIDAGKLFRDLDANADGQLAAGEVGEEHRLLLKRLVRTGDEDGNGRLTAEEFATALTPVRAEKNLVQKQGSRLPGADALTVLLVKMDANRDQQLEAEEVPERYQRLFDQMLRPGDDDKDGMLNRREIARAAPRLSIMAQMAATRMGLDVAAEMEKLPAEQMAAMEQMDAYPRPGEMMADPAQAKRLFKRLDANGDKRLAADEAPGPMAERFEQMLQRGDRDGDQHLSEQEFMAMSRRMAQFGAAKADPATTRRTMRQLLKRFDRDGDGQLSVREAPPRLAENFDRADGDANGVLDRAELTRVAETMARLQKFAGERAGLGPPATEADEAPGPARKKPSARKSRGKPRG